MNLTPAIRNDLRRALAAHHYEHTDDGRLFIPKSGLFVGGAFSTDVNGLDRRVAANDVVNECLDDVLNVYFKQSAQRTAFYIAPFAGNVVVDKTTLTAANFAAVQTEFTAYNESTRVAWSAGSVANQEVSNTASPSTFTISTANSTVWGFAMLTASAKSATTGLLVAAAKDTDPRDNLRVGDKLNVEYILEASDA